MSAFQFSLPELTKTKDMDAIKSYLMQLQDQVQFAVNNVDEDNFTVTYRRAQDEKKQQEEEKSRDKTEAMASYIIKNATETATEFDRKLENNQSKISTQMEETFKAMLDSDVAIVGMRTLLEQTAQALTIEAEKITEIRDNQTGLLETQSQIQTSFMFQADGLVIASVGSPFALKIMKDKISFLQNQEEVAYISNNSMKITSGDFISRMSIKSGTGYFDFVSVYNGLGIQWRNGNE